MWAHIFRVAMGLGVAMQDSSSLLFADDFEGGLNRWRIIGENAIRIRNSGDPAHGAVMELTPNGDAAAIIRQSRSWGRVRMDGQMLFPSADDNYLGFLYNLVERRGRLDFGLIYLKGNDNYLQVNPHRDFNVSRLVYPEGRSDLSGASRVGVNTWHPFALEVDGHTAHVYIGAGRTPQITFDVFEHASGELGLQPRSVGAPVWVDNVSVRRLAALSYSGPPIPSVAYHRDRFLTDWRVAGPYARTDDALARNPAAHKSWTAFTADARGAVITGRVVDYHGPDAVAYFRTTIRSPRQARAELQFSTADDLAVWANGEFQAFLARQEMAWFDADVAQEHRGRRLPIVLEEGDNEIVVRVRGGVYASGGFFARLAKES